MGGWEPRYVLITAKDGLMSFRNKDEPPTLRITETHELWSRFETINSDKWIVMKLWNGFIKEEFAVPVYRGIKWLKAFYHCCGFETLMMEIIMIISFLFPHLPTGSYSSWQHEDKMKDHYLTTFK